MTEQQTGSVQQSSTDKGNGKERGKSREERLRFQEERRRRRIEMAGRDDVEVISRRSPETNDFIRLLTINDYIVNRLRNLIGRRNGVPAAVGIRLLEHNEHLRDELNRLNAEMCQVMNLPYKPPRGFENPLEEA